MSDQDQAAPQGSGPWSSLRTNQLQHFLFHIKSPAAFSYLQPHGEVKLCFQSKLDQLEENRRQLAD